ncbi:solute carrier family 2, facilitated glucose transporter member 11-like, partial [Lampetra fluviatilis]
AVQEFINATWLSRHGESLSPDGLLLLWSLVVAAFTAGGLLGALLAGPLAVRVGRRNGLLASNAFTMAASLMLGLSRAASSFELIIAGRLVMGINSGIGMSLQPMYLGESALQHQRGALAMTTIVFCTFGLIVGQLAGLKQVLGEPQLWPLALSLPALPAALQLVSLPWLPESPRHLLLDRGETRRALAALRWLRGADGDDGDDSGDGGDGGGSVEREMEQMEEERSVAARSVLDLLRDPGMRRQIVIIVALNILQQMSGVNAIYFYATSLFAQAGISDEDVPYVTLGTGIAEAVTTLIFGLTIDLLGRRPLLICGFGLTSICCILITVSMLLQATVTWLAYVSVALIFAFIVCFALGPAGIIGILPAELFMQSERPAAFVVAGAVNWGSFIVISVIFPFLM